MGGMPHERKGKRLEGIRASWRANGPPVSQILKKSLEVVAVAVIVAIANRLGPFEAGFVASPANPYVLFSLFAAVWFGTWYGFLALLLSLISLFIPFPRQGPSLDAMQLVATYKISFLWTLVAVYVFGLVHDNFLDQLGAKNKFLRKAASEKSRLDTEKKALVEVNRDLEERVLRQQESITSLFARIRDLTTQSVGETLAILLDMVRQYAWATKASVWIYKPEDNSLECEATIGWEEEEKGLQRIPSADTIEGWVVRNNLVFSARMLINYANLRKMDKGRNILAFPISFGKTVWGVLNIEHMPFSKFNLYTEKILGVLLELGSPAIERSVANERLMFTQLHPETSLPLYPVLRRKMEQWASSSEYQGSGFSVIILELSKFDAIMSKYGEKKVFALIRRYMGEIKALSGNVLDLYHYRNEGQMALFYPQIDFDGTALFCFDLLGMLNGKVWQIDEDAVPMDLLMGYANSGKGRVDVDSILVAAEEVLGKQKRQP